MPDGFYYILIEELRFEKQDFWNVLVNQGAVIIRVTEYNCLPTTYHPLTPQGDHMMTPEERNDKIQSYGTAYQRLLSALEDFPPEMWQFRPAPERWTIHEIVVHIADSEANSYVRCRRILAEPGSTVLGYDEEKWARTLAYHDQSTDDALELFKWLRHKSYTLIRDLPATVWSNTVNHTEIGIMTMDDWLDIYERHIPEHIEQMQAIYADWVRQKGAG
jgi:hypothetical protein